MTDNNKNLTNYQLLHRKLDDGDFAREFTKRQTERAQELIAQILMVTSGVSEVTGEDREWGHANFLELLDIFQIHHDNFSLFDLSEDLQSYVYTFSMAHGQAFREWKAGHYQERGLDEDGLEIETVETVNEPPPAETVLDLSACAPEMLNTRISELGSLKDLSCVLSGVMENPNLPVKVYNILADTFDHIANPNAPENILLSLEE